MYSKEILLKALFKNKIINWFIYHIVFSRVFDFLHLNNLLKYLKFQVAKAKYLY